MSWVDRHSAAKFSYSYMLQIGEAVTLVWRDIPLGGERGVLDATVRIAKNADGSQAWSLSFDNRSANWALFATDFPRLDRVVGNWWRRADGKVVLLAANLTDRPQHVEYRVYGKENATAEMQLQPFEMGEVKIGNP